MPGQIATLRGGIGGSLHGSGGGSDDEGVFRD